MSSDPLALLASLVLDDGRRWGEAATAFQWADAAAIVAEEEPRYHYLTRPRGASKTTDLAGVGLVLLAEVLAPSSQAYAVAADADQAALLLREAAGFVARTPEQVWPVGGVPRVELRRVIVPSGSSLVVLSADGPSAYGLRPALLIADEFAQWPDTPNTRTLWEAALSSLSKSTGARLVILTTAGSPEHPAYRLLGQAQEAPKRWRVHEVPGPTPWLDRDVLAEQERLLLPSQYARLHLNRWTAPEDRLSSRDQVLACVGHEGPVVREPGRRYVVTVDLGLKRDRTAVVVASVPSTGGERVVRVDRCDVWRGTSARPVQLSEVEEHVRELARHYRCKVRGDPWQAVGMYQRLRSRSIAVEEFVFTPTSASRVAVGLFLAIRDRAVDLPDDPELTDELASVRLVERSPNVWRLDTVAGRHDDRAVALAMAVDWLTSKRATAPVTLHSARGHRIRSDATVVGDAGRARGWVG
ncbi:MAG TPA: terminase large subunit [Acidimicrobiales bacterium]|nr:terminase large subunit [Acidimicrobiales bacterium]